MGPPHLAFIYTQQSNIATWSATASIIEGRHTHPMRQPRRVTTEDTAAHAVQALIPLILFLLRWRGDTRRGLQTTG